MNGTPEMFIYPIHIRPGLVVRVQMPTDITKAEAEKVARVVAAMASK